jgi:hypothetical protein
MLVPVYSIVKWDQIIIGDPGLGQFYPDLFWLDDLVTFWVLR